MDVPAGGAGGGRGLGGSGRPRRQATVPHRLERWPVLTTGCIPSAPASSPCRSPSGSSTTAEARSRPGVPVSCPVARPERYRAVHPDTSPVTGRRTQYWQVRACAQSTNRSEWSPSRTPKGLEPVRGENKALIGHDLRRFRKLLVTLAPRRWQCRPAEPSSTGAHTEPVIPTARRRADLVGGGPCSRAAHRSDLSGCVLLMRQAHRAGGKPCRSRGGHVYRPSHSTIGV